MHMSMHMSTHMSIHIFIHMSMYMSAYMFYPHVSMDVCTHGTTGRNESQLLSFLRKLKRLLAAIEVGDSLMLPLLVELGEMMLIVWTCV